MNASETASPPEVSVVIPSYNRRESVLALLADLSRQEGAAAEVIVVDDCSPDGSADAIAERFPAVTLIRSERNGGPCVARNRGVQAARGEWIVGLDSDVTVPDRRLLQKVCAAFRAAPPRVAGFAFRLFRPDGATDDRERWWHPVPLDPFAGQRFETSYFSGTAYAFRRQAMTAAGLYPEILYMHYEEVVLAFRVLDGGGALEYRPELAALHHAHQTDRRSRIRVFYKPRNQVLLALLCYPFAAGLGYLAPRLGYNFYSALRNGHAADFLRALASAGALAAEAWKQRRPLAPTTWRRIRRLSRQTPVGPGQATPAPAGQLIGSERYEPAK